MRTFGLAAALLLALLTGFWAGRLTAPLPPPQPERPPVVEAPPQLQRQAPPPADLPTCQEQLALAVGILDAQERERVGTPVPFPPDLPEQYRPEGFEDAVREALEACPEAGIELAHVDCSEFPCMAFFSQPTGSNNHAVERLSGCASWSERFERSGQANSRFVTDEGRAEYSMLAPSPLDATFDENDGKRWNERLQQGEEALMAAWGGRELTPLEQVDEQLAFWREVGGEDAEWFIKDLQARRQKLLEAQE